MEQFILFSHISGAFLFIINSFLSLFFVFFKKNNFIKYSNFSFAFLMIFQIFSGVFLAILTKENIQTSCVKLVGYFVLQLITVVLIQNVYKKNLARA